MSTKVTITYHGDVDEVVHLNVRDVDTNTAGTLVAVNTSNGDQLVYPLYHVKSVRVEQA
jgi:hypothetical protein